MKVSADFFQTIRVMEANQSSVKMRLQEVRNQAVDLTVSPTQDGTIFFNEERGGTVTPIYYPLDFDNSTPVTNLGSAFPRGVIKFIRGSVKWVEEERIVTDYNNRVRKCLIKDATGESLLSIWNHWIDEIKEGQWYLFSYVEQTHFHGNELSCTKQSIVEQCKEEGEISWDNLQQFCNKSSTSQEETTICCPDIVAVKIEQLLHCPICEFLCPKVTLITCSECGERTVLKQAIKKLQDTLRLIKNDFMMTLIFGEVSSPSPDVSKT